MELMVKFPDACFPSSTEALTAVPEAAVFL
jgi:hypothetical protein